ncbi:MotA/TolQ/ExbB proton channel family protein [Salinisphaera sp. T31B1]|uniref:MotA/TolQ/ExbB proton channel family protein n=1 Tax=Salinisphaera sp. T31B1 TaxID=727963 RepID=UPI003341FBC6
MNAFIDQLAGIGDALSNIVFLGGPVVLLLIVMSIVAAAIVIAKAVQFRRVRINDRRTARSALSIYRTGNAGAAMTMARRSPNPASRVLARAIQLRARHDIPEPVMREEILQYGGDMLESLRSHLRPLEVIASLAPLLGLFGTVLGMIEAFRDLEAAGSQVNPALLSGGIWQALLTTAIGLAVAMPTIVALNWLERAIDRAAHEMDSVVTRVFTADLSRQPGQTLSDEDDEHGHSTPFI